MKALKLTVLAAILSTAPVGFPAAAQNIDYEYAYVTLYYEVVDGSRREVGREVGYCDGSNTLTGYRTSIERTYQGFCD